MSAERFKHLFRGRETVRGRYYENNGKKKVKTELEPPTDAMWDDHIAGKGPYLGIVPITLTNDCFFGAIDIDDDGVDLAEIDRKVSEAGLPLVVCRSKSGGAHLYLFLPEAERAQLVQSKLKEYARAIGFTENADGRAVEIFPKQTKLGPDETGNWINLPYYGGDESNRYAVMGTRKLSLAEFLDLAEATRSGIAERGGLGAIKQSVKSADFFQDGPPCLQTLHQLGYPAGSRNQGLYNIGVYFKLSNPDGWREELEEYNETRMDPPLSPTEVAGVAKSLEKREYLYKCGEIPISPHCKRSECRKRRFGIDAFKHQADLDNFPSLENLTKIQTDPPRWEIDVNGITVEVATDDLLALHKFRKTCLERASIIVPMVKQHLWDEKIRELLASHKVVEAPEDAGTAGAFNVLLAGFLGMMARSETRDDLLLGKPYAEGERVYFRSIDLNSYLKRNNFNDYNQARVFTALRARDADHHQFTIRGQTIQVWSLPLLGGMVQTEDFGTPQGLESQF
jgi:hypothetical protein